MNAATPTQTRVRGALTHAAGIDLAAYHAGHVDERVRRSIEREQLSTEYDLVRLVRASPAARGAGSAGRSPSP